MRRRIVYDAFDAFGRTTARQGQPDDRFD